MRHQIKLDDAMRCEVERTIAFSSGSRGKELSVRIPQAGNLRGAHYVVTVGFRGRGRPRERTFRSLPRAVAFYNRVEESP